MKIKGWQNVFKFTYIQNIKNKSFVISSVVMSALIALMILGVNFIPTFFMDEISGTTEPSDDESVLFPITDIYLFNETEYDFSAVGETGVNITVITESQLADITQRIFDSNTGEILVQISNKDDGYDILISRPNSEEVIDNGVCGVAASVFSSILENERLKAIGIDDEGMKEFYKAVSISTTIAGEEPHSELMYVINSVVPVLSSMILFIFILAYGQIIAQAIATEKTSKVMELLLTSVRPLAVIIGKIFGIGLVSLTQMAIIGAVASGSFILSAPFGFLGQLFGDTSQIPEIQLISGEISAAFSNFGVGTIFGIVIFFILGFLFYAFIAGLIGASISRLEDLNTAMQPMVFISLLGFYLSYLPSIFNVESSRANMFMTIARYLPISSPFSLPSAMILGEMGIVEIIVSAFILLAFDLLMLLIVAKVYESIVLHTGDRIKIKDLAKIMRTR